MGFWDKFKEYFDDFALNARVMPVVVDFIPVLLIAVVRGFAAGDWGESTVVFILALASLALLSRLARNQGKKFEDKMFAELGAKPSVILLRFSDGTFNNVIKRRYHKQLNRVYGLYLPVNPANEADESDAQYEAAAKALKVRANSMRDKEFRVYQELKEYHFLRNLYGTKWVCVTAYLFLALREVFFVIPEFSIVEAIRNPYPDYIALLAYLFFAVVMCALVTKESVKKRAFDYARTLIETCEHLGEEQARPDNQD